MLLNEAHVAYQPVQPPGAIGPEVVDRLYRWTVPEYHRMTEAGLLPRDARTELVEGQIVHMSPVGALHIGFQGYLQRRLGNVLAENQYFVTGQSPLWLDEYNDPQPDVYVLPFRADHYTTLKPTAEDALLACEVSVSPLEYDLGDKMRRYARFGIPEYWVVDAEARELHYFDDPYEGGFRRSLVLAQAASFVSELLGECVVGDWMPPGPQVEGDEPLSS